MPLPLQQVAVPLPGNGTGRFLGLIPTECHTATILWMWHSTYGALPTVADDKLIKKVGAYATIMRRVAKRGRHLKAASRYTLPLVPDNVLVFTQDGNAMHSCIVKTATTIAGYNQTNWFLEDGARTKGISSAYSKHQIIALNWQQPFPSETVRRGDHSYKLMVVDEAKALEEFRR